MSCPQCASRQTIAILLRKQSSAAPLWAQAPLTIPKLWQSYSVALGKVVELPLAKGRRRVSKNLL